MDEVMVVMIFNFVKKLVVEIVIDVISGVITKLMMGGWWGQIIFLEHMKALMIESAPIA